jgi:DNA-binding beta-propeller fold protein YncE
MRNKWLAGAIVSLIGLWPALAPKAMAAEGAGEPVPVFAVDPAWPQIPNGWTLGLVSKISIDRHGNVWIIHRPGTVAAGKTAAPPVLELGPAGKLVRAWGGQAAGYDWPLFEHNIYVDQRDNVFISGSSPNGPDVMAPSDDMILKFTADGKFIKQFGGRSASRGSNDTTSVNKPGDLYVWPKTNELFIADGYGNRRVLVLDADTFAFKRMWGAFGKPPVDDAESGGPGMLGGAAGQKRAEGGGANPEPNATGPGSPSFTAPVHGVLISNDGILYVSDRANRRVQVFTPQGRYITQIFVNRAGPKSETASGLAFSADPEQKYLYIADYGNSHVLVLDRKSLKILYQFGQRGTEPGNFRGIHHIAVDAKGNLYAAEVAPGARAQRFIYQGLSNNLPPNALSPEQLPPGALDGQ